MTKFGGKGNLQHPEWCQTEKTAAEKKKKVCLRMEKGKVGGKGFRRRKWRMEPSTYKMGKGSAALALLEVPIPSKFPLSEREEGG